MAITINKEPAGIYPVYNDSFIEFTSSLTDNNRAEITVHPTATFPNVFTLYPDADGVYLFNLKEFGKTILNANRFDDVNFFDDAYFKSISGLYLLQAIDIEVFSETTSEGVTKYYDFFKSVKQVDEVIFNNPFQLLNYSKNGVDFYLTYFEGFPFHFDIQRVLYVALKVLNVKNVNSGLTSPDMTPTADGAFRFNVDRSNSDNWTDGGFLPLNTGLNKLEIYEDGVFKVNVHLTKKKLCSGVYLKFWNSDGGFSHWLFDEFSTEQIQGRNIDLINSNEFKNVGEYGAQFKSTGKTARRKLRLKTKCTEKEAEQLRALFYSPLIQIYTSKEAYVKGVFIDVDIEDTYEFKNKKGLNEFVVTVDLPDMITAIL